MNFEKGSIVELGEGLDEKYIILNTIDKVDKEYILAATWKNIDSIKEVLLDSMKNNFSNIVLIEHDIKNNKYNFSNDREALIAIVYKTLEEENMENM